MSRALVAGKHRAVGLAGLAVVDANNAIASDSRNFLLVCPVGRYSAYLHVRVPLAGAWALDQDLDSR
jgi:hypothetical protein